MLHKDKQCLYICRMKPKHMNKKQTLVHFALRTEESTIAELEQLAVMDDRKLRTVANMALKEGAKVLRKRFTRATR